MQRLSDVQWERIREHFPEENLPDDRPGGKPITLRKVLDGVPWIRKPGALWHMLTDLASTLRNEGAVMNASASSTRRLPLRSAVKA
jgi:hypothetical protein